MPPSPEPIYIAIIGAGGVGSIFISQLSPLQLTFSYLKVVLITRSSRSIKADPIHGEPIPLATWSSNLSHSKYNALSPSEILDYLRSGDPSRSIIIDNTSSQVVAEAYPHFLSEGISIVTPNKKAFSGSQTLWEAIYSRASTVPRPPRGDTIRRGRLLYHESSVGAGMPVISTLRDLIDTGDKVKRIEGVMSGSLSYLFNNFMPLSPSTRAKGGSETWSALVSEAQKLGYTEPDPRDDLSGLDVARKLVILARLVGFEFENGTDAFPIQSLIPPALQSVESGEEFLARLPEFDSEMENMRAEAEKEGKVMRFVGSVDVVGRTCGVGLQRLDASSPLAGLKGSANVFSFWTERYGDDPLVVQGAGAGGEVTAMGVTADLIKVVQRLGPGQS